jgi:hypothetical protein
LCVFIHFYWTSTHTHKNQKAFRYETNPCWKFSTSFPTHIIGWPYFFLKTFIKNWKFYKIQRIKFYHKFWNSENICLVTLLYTQYVLHWAVKLRTLKIATLSRWSQYVKHIFPGILVCESIEGHYVIAFTTSQCDFLCTTLTYFVDNHHWHIVLKIPFLKIYRVSLSSCLSPPYCVTNGFKARHVQVFQFVKVKGKSLWKSGEMSRW